MIGKSANLAVIRLIKITTPAAPRKNGPLTSRDSPSFLLKKEIKKITEGNPSARNAKMNFAEEEGKDVKEVE